MKYLGTCTGCIRLNPKATKFNLVTVYFYKFPRSLIIQRSEQMTTYGLQLTVLVVILVNNNIIIFFKLS